MKKILIALLVCAMALSLVACANNTSAPAAESPAAQQPSEAPAESPEAPAEPAEPAKSEAPADDSWDKVKAAGTFILGFDETFAPMGFKDEDGNYVGFDIDLATEVSSRLGLDAPTLMPINWDSKVMELNAGNIDLIWNGLTITEERKKEMLFSDPYMDNRQIIVVRAESDIQSKADLAGKIVAAQADSSALKAIRLNPKSRTASGIWWKARITWKRCWSSSRAAWTRWSWTKRWAATTSTRTKTRRRSAYWRITSVKSSTASVSVKQMLR